MLEVGYGVICYRVDVFRRTVFMEIGMSSINRIAQATVNKFNPGDRVKISDNLGHHMAHYPSGKLAIVKYTYAQAYRSTDDRSMQQYCLDVDGIGVVSWYDEQQLIVVTNNPIPISF